MIIIKTNSWLYNLLNSFPLKYFRRMERCRVGSNTSDYNQCWFI